MLVVRSPAVHVAESAEVGGRGCLPPVEGEELWSCLPPVEGGPWDGLENSRVRDRTQSCRVPPNTSFQSTMCHSWPELKPDSSSTGVGGRCSRLDGERMVGVDPPLDSATRRAVTLGDSCSGGDGGGATQVGSAEWGSTSEAGTGATAPLFCGHYGGSYCAGLEGCPSLPHPKSLR